MSVAAEDTLATDVNTDVELDDSSHTEHEQVVVCLRPHTHVYTQIYVIGP